LVILVVVNKGVKSLVEVLVYNFGLAIGLKIKYSKKFNFNFKDIVKFVLKIQYKLRLIVGDYGL